MVKGKPTSSATKTYDLWSADNGTKAVNAPKPLNIAPGWTIPVENVPASRQRMPRRRVVAAIRPNLRAAVPVPVEGQSYNPAADDHLALVSQVAKSLIKKKKAHERFVRQMNNKGDGKYHGTLTTDKTWDNDDEEAEEEDNNTGKGSASTQQSNNANKKALVASTNKKDKDSKKKNKKKDKKKQAKKENTIELNQKTQRQRTHRRHPERASTLDQVDELDELVKEQELKNKLSAERSAKHNEKRRAAQSVKVYGRHYYQPLVADVAPSTALVGSLRHLAASKSVHPALDRMKSMEERNLVPARMRHKYNQRTDFMPHGQVVIKRERFGTAVTES
jgi:hypothetical protein